MNLSRFKSGHSFPINNRGFSKNRQMFLDQSPIKTMKATFFKSTQLPCYALKLLLFFNSIQYSLLK